MPRHDVEERAAAAACWVLGDAHAVVVDDGSASSLRDYDLVFDDGHIEPLEVTTFADERVVRTSQRLSRTNKAAATLRRVWTVDAPSTSVDAAGRNDALDVRAFLRDAEPAIETFEAAGVHSYTISGTWDERPDVAAAQRALLQLGSQFDLSREPLEGEEPRIEIGAGVGGVAHGDLIAWAAEVEAGKADNQLKLADPPGALRRHLFVVVDGSTGPTLSAGHRGLIGRLPELPSPITTVWVAAGSALYVTTPPEPWQVHRPPDDVFNDPGRWIDRP